MLELMALVVMVVMPLVTPTLLPFLILYLRSDGAGAEVLVVLIMTVKVISQAMMMVIPIRWALILPFIPSFLSLRVMTLVMMMTVVFMSLQIITQTHPTLIPPTLLPSCLPSFLPLLTPGACGFNDGCDASTAE